MKASRSTTSPSRPDATRPPGPRSPAGAPRETFSSFVRNLARLESERGPAPKGGADRR